MAQQPRPEHLERRLAFYTVAASAGMLASAASAAPTNANINLTVSAGQGTSDFEEFDVDGDLSDDFTLEVVNDISDGYGGYCGEIRLFSNNTSGWTAYAQPIAPGTQVDDSFVYANYDWLYGGCPQLETGVFGLEERGFIGFRIPADATRGPTGSWHYGYMDVEVTGDLTGIIHEVIFESTPDTPITVVGTGPIPETRSVPVGGAVPLGLLLFAAGAAALRRRNRAEA